MTHSSRNPLDSQWSDQPHQRTRCMHSQHKNMDDGKSAQTERLATKQKLFSFPSVSSSSSWNLLPFPSLTRLLLALTALPFSDSARNLGFILDSKLSMKKHVIKICQTAYFELKRIQSRAGKFITEDATKTIVTSRYILSRLDYRATVSFSYVCVFTF